MLDRSKGRGQSKKVQRADSAPQPSKATDLGVGGIEIIPFGRDNENRVWEGRDLYLRKEDGSGIVSVLHHNNQDKKAMECERTGTYDEQEGSGWCRPCHPQEKKVKGAMLRKDCLQRADDFT